MFVTHTRLNFPSFPAGGCNECLPSGAALLAHPGEDPTGDIIVVSAPRCTLLRAAEELGLCKSYADGNMEAFSYDDKDNFKDSGRPAASAFTFTPPIVVE